MTLLLHFHGQRSTKWRAHKYGDGYNGAVYSGDDCEDKNFRMYPGN